LNGALIAAGLVDEFLIYLAPKLLGGKDANGRGMAEFSPLSALSDAMAMSFVSVDKVGQDLRILGRIPGRDTF
jgi:diaminohydroxyphosphoribosylaminopyrimidine deaminase / 5-amino-6-(5-phosphoribosylamino)uracil reductase